MYERWAECAELTIVQATFFSLGMDPTWMQEDVETINVLERPAGYEARKQAIISGVRVNKIKGTIVPRRIRSERTGRLRTAEHTVDATLSCVETLSLLSWMGQLTRVSPAPNFLDPKDPKYSPLFAAAVRARDAVDETPKGMTPKQALIRYLRKNEPTLTEDARRAIVKVVNWKRSGGAPRTAGKEKPTAD